MKVDQDEIRDYNFSGELSGEEKGQSSSPLSPIKRKLTKRGEMVMDPAIKEEGQSDTEEKELRIVELLDQSETYMQRNLNAVCNNMSLLTLHSFEFGNEVEKARNDQLVKEKVIKNVEGLAEFLKDKSGKLSRRLLKATAKLGKVDLIADPKKDLIRRQSLVHRN